MLVTTRSLDRQGSFYGIHNELEIRKVIDELLTKPAGLFHDWDKYLSNLSYFKFERAFSLGN